MRLGYGSELLDNLLNFTSTRKLMTCAGEKSSCSVAQAVSKAFAIDGHINILLGISFGFEDPAVPANQTWIDREPIDKLVTFKR